MTKAEIMSAIGKLSHNERREIMKKILEAGRDAEILEECDRLVLERLQMLDSMEAGHKTHGHNSNI